MKGGVKLGNKFKLFGEAVRSKVKGVFGSKSGKYSVTPQNGTSMKVKSESLYARLTQNPITKSVISINPTYSTFKRQNKPAKSKNPIYNIQNLKI